MADEAGRPRWEVQPWVIAASFVLCVLLAAFSLFAAEPVDSPAPTTIYAEAPRAVGSLTRADVRRLRAYVDALLEQADLNQEIRDQLREVRDLLDGVDEGDVTLPPAPSGTTPPATTTTTSAPPRTTTTTTTQPPRVFPVPADILDQLRDDYVTPTTVP